jgi:hypothetical protein
VNERRTRPAHEASNGEARGAVAILESAGHDLHGNAAEVAELPQEAGSALAQSARLRFLGKKERRGIHRPSQPEDEAFVGWG